MNPRSVVRDLIRRSFAAVMLTRATAPFYNQLFEQSPHWLADILNRLHTQPNFDMIWTVRLMNGHRVRTLVDADNPRSWEFATAYHWHDVGIRVLEYVLLLGSHTADRKAVVFDIGANMGVRSLLPLSMGIQTILFEPNCALRGFSEDVFRRNGFEHYEIVNVCLSDQDGVAPFYLSTNSYGSSLDRQWPALDADATKIDTKVTTLDRWISERSEIAGKAALVKIDVEGAELKVLSGARDFISSAKPQLIVEVSSSPNNRKRVAQFCEDIGYHIFLIENTDHPSLHKLDSDQFVQAQTSANFFMTHAEQETPI
jgi:FkbM family methyltransferase